MGYGSAPTGPATVEGSDILDLDHLRAQTFGDADLEREVLGLFLAQSGVLLRAVENGPERAEAAHKLLGSARSIGLPVVAAAARRTEAVLLADPAAAECGLEDLRRAIADAEAAILRLTAG